MKQFRNQQNHKKEGGLRRLARKKQLADAILRFVHKKMGKIIYTVPKETTDIYIWTLINR